VEWEKNHRSMRSCGAKRYLPVPKTGRKVERPLAEKERAVDVRADVPRNYVLSRISAIGRDREQQQGGGKDKVR